MARYSGWVSEHSHAHAIDLTSFELENGSRVSVLGHYASTRERDAKARQFLRTALRRAYDEGVFSVVLGPDFDALHRDHFHLDLARYRVDGAGPEGAR
jgi:hypothetical protein